MTMRFGDVTPVDKEIMEKRNARTDGLGTGLHRERQQIKLL